MVLPRLGIGMVAAVGVVGALCGFFASAAVSGRQLNPVVMENVLPGTAGWRLPRAPGRAIEGYTSEVSALPGQMVQVHVSTLPAASYRVEVFRVGWYGGLGGRLVACVPDCQMSEQGSPQPVPASNSSNGFLDAGWPVTDTFRVGPDWISGYYLVELVLASGPSAGEGNWLPLIVREPATRQSQILVQVPVNTWQAYNDWGGRSLYFNHTGIGDNHVSFNRPYDTSWLRTAAGPQTGGSGNLPQVLEFPLVRFLEQRGYDVSYTTDVDTDADPSELLRHRLVIIAGHDEYWSKPIRDAFDHALALGTNIALLGANTGFWQMRYQDDHRTIIEYRKSTTDPEPDPTLKTTMFRNLVPPRPECELFGVQSANDTGPGNNSIGIANYSPNPTALSDPWFKGTRFTATSVFPDLVGFEWDLITPGCPTPPLTDLFHYAGHVPADGVRYTAPSGARVFSAGTLRFSWALDPSTTPGDPGATFQNPGLQRFMQNALNDLTRPAAATSIRATRTGKTVTITITRHADPRIQRTLVYRGRKLVCKTTRPTCTDHHPPRSQPVTYIAKVQDRWTTSVATLSSQAAAAPNPGPPPSG
jgi:hypothetical protein